MDPSTTCVIANPAAAGGRVGRQWTSIEAEVRAALGPVQIQRTTVAGHGVVLAEQAVRDGCTTILSMGGDGTHNEVVNGIMEASPEPGAITLGILPAGTGGDFRRLLQDSESISTSARGLAGATSHPVDVGLVRFRSHQGVAKEGYFLNISSFGVSGKVVQLVNDSSKRLGGRATFYLCTLRALIGYKSLRVRLRLDGKDLGGHSITNVLVCNGQYAGGGMHFAPNARLADGLFDVVVVDEQTLARTIRLTGKIYSGEHIHERDVHVYRGSRLLADVVGLQNALLDVDGEQPGILPAEFEVCPGAIRLLHVSEHVL